MIELDSRERVTFRGQSGKTTIEAKVDSGAARTSIDHKIAARIGAGPVTSSVVVNGEHRRPVATVWVEVGGFDEQLAVSLSDRSERTTMAILGTDVLEQDGVTVDVTSD